MVCDDISVSHPRYLYPPKLLRNWYGHFFRRSVRAAFDRACDEFCPDIVLGCWAYPDGWAAVDLAKRRGLPVVIKVHGCDILCGGAGLEHNPERHQRTTEALLRADGVIAVSRHLAEKVLDLGIPHERVHVVYDGIDSTLFHPGSTTLARSRLGLPVNVPMVLFVGNLVHVKGIEILLSACAEIGKRNVDFSVCIIGKGPLKLQLTQQIRDLGLDGRVRLLGSLPHSQLGDWYRAANVFALPSFSEGVPNVLLEAAACGTPFVASQVGGIPEIAHLGSSRLVPPGNSGALADALAEFLSINTPAAAPAPSASWAESADSMTCVLETVLMRQVACQSHSQKVVFDL